MHYEKLSEFKTKEEERKFFDTRAKVFFVVFQFSLFITPITNILTNLSSISIETFLFFLFSHICLAIVLTR